MRPARLPRLALALAALGLPAALSGCGEPPKSEVAGTITLNGKPPGYTGLEVVFVHSGGAQVAAPVHEDGTYKAEGVPAGDVMVCFAYITPEAAQQGAEFKAAGGRKMKKPGEKPAAAPKPAGLPGPKTSPVPAPLRDTSTSNLTLKVESGKVTSFDYDLK